MGYRRPFLVLLAIPPLAAERKEWLTMMREISQMLVGCRYGHRFFAFVYNNNNNRLVQRRNGIKWQKAAYMVPDLRRFVTPWAVSCLDQDRNARP